MKALWIAQPPLIDWLGELAPPDRLHVTGGACPDPVRTCKAAFNSLIQIWQLLSVILPVFN